MLKATATDTKGTSIILIGLSRKNLETFTNEMGDTYIRVTGGEMGIDFDIIIFSGETESEMALTVFTDGSTKTFLHRDEV